MMLEYIINYCITYRGDFRDRSAENAYEVAVATTVCQPLEDDANPSVLSQTVPCLHFISSGRPRTSTKRGMSYFSKRKSVLHSASLLS